MLGFFLLERENLNFFLKFKEKCSSFGVFSKFYIFGYFVKALFLCIFVFEKENRKLFYDFF